MMDEWAKQVNEDGDTQAYFVVKSLLRIANALERLAVVAEAREAREDRERRIPQLRKERG